MTVAPAATPHRPPRRRPVTASSKGRSLPLPAGSGASGAPAFESEAPQALVSPPPPPPLPPNPTCSTSSTGTEASLPFSLKSTILRGTTWTPGTKAAVGVVQESGPSRAVLEPGLDDDDDEGRNTAHPSTRRATGDQLFGPWPGLGDPPLQGQGIGVSGTAGSRGPAFETVQDPKRFSLREVVVDSSPRLASADATHQRDSFVHRIARGLARKRSAAATPAAPVPEATTSPTTMSPPLSPIQQLASPSIRSPTSLPASSPPAEYERDQKDALHLRGDDDTPIPSPPASALAEPTYERPRPFRTLNWSFLPSRSARVVANRRPVIDRPLNDEEREWVEVAAKVPDDGTTRDRWDNPIGTRGDWGRTVLSPIVTETETSSVSLLKSQAHSHPPPPTSSDQYLSTSLVEGDPSQLASHSSYSAKGENDTPLPARGRDLVSPPLIPLPKRLAATSPHAHTRANTLVDPTRQSTRHAATSAPTNSITPTRRSASGVSAGTSRRSTRTATPSASSSSVTQLGDRSPWLTSTNAEDGHRFSTPPTSPTTSAANHHHSPETKPRLKTGHDYHSLSTIETSRVADSVPAGPRRAKSRDVETACDRRNRAESVMTAGTAFSPESLVAPAVSPVDIGSTPPRAGDTTTAKRSSRTSDAAPPIQHRQQATPQRTERADSISRWRAAVVPASTSEHAPDWSKNGFRSDAGTSSAEAGSRPGRARSGLATSSKDHPSSASRARRSTRTIAEAAATTLSRIAPTVDDADSDHISPPFSPPLSSPMRPRAATSYAAAEVSPSVYGESTLPDAWETHPSRFGYPDGYTGGFEQQYPPPSPGYQLTDLPDINERRDHLPRTPSTPRTVSPSHYAPSGWSTPRPSKASSARSSRPGSYPVPELTAEERAQRRAMRKAGLSPEHHLPPQSTKAGLRRQAWQERQVFEAERDRLLQLLPANDSDDPAANPFEHLSIRDVPVLNQLSDLHFGTSIRATRDAGVYYLQLSLRLDEHQPDRAHTLALLLEAQDPEEALYWHQIAVRHAPDDPDYLLHLSNAYRSLGNVDSAAHAFGELTLRFKDTPFEALGWYKLARLFEDCETPEERADAHESFAKAYECLERLAQVPLVDRRAGPWEILGQVEEGTLFGLGLFGEPVQHLPRLFAIDDPVSEAGPSLAPSPPLSPTPLDFSPRSTGVRAASVPVPASASEAPPERSATGSWSPPATAFPNPTPESAIPGAPTSAGTAAPRRHDARKSDSAAEQVSRRASSGARSSQPRRRKKVDPVVARTLDTVVKGLHAMSRSQNVTSLTASTHELADQVEMAFQRMYESQTQEAQHPEELFRVLEQVHRELTTLPDRVDASAKLSASRPPGVEPLVPSLDPVERALRRVEQARLLSV